MKKPGQRMAGRAGHPERGWLRMLLGKQKTNNEIMLSTQNE